MTKDRQSIRGAHRRRRPVQATHLNRFRCVVGRARDDSAVSSLEMAILFPFAMLIILLMFQISLYWHTSNTVAAAADIGLDAGQVFPDDLPRARAEAEAAAQWMLNASNHRDGTPTATVDGNRLTVTVVANSPRIVGIGSWQVQSVAEGRFEEFVPVNNR